MIEIPLSLEELRRETIKEILDQTPPEQLLGRLSVEKRLEGLSPEVRLEGLPPENLRKRLCCRWLRMSLTPDPSPQHS